MPCCSNCTRGLPCGFGQAPPWYDPTTMLDAYERTERALDAARAQRPRMTPADAQLLAGLIDAWDTLPNRAVAVTPVYPNREAVWSSLVAIERTAGALVQRVTGRAAPAPVPPTVPPPMPPPQDEGGGGWQWPELPGLPSIPSFPGLALKIPPEAWLVAIVVGLLWLSGRGRG